MIANAEVVITQKSTCTFVALALDKQVYSQMNLDELRRLMPLQNRGESSHRIASLCHRILHTPMPVLDALRLAYRYRSKSITGSKSQPKSRWEIPNP
jgi:predicted membrane chloride channel (bestrophin family)